MPLQISDRTAAFDLVEVRKSQQKKRKRDKLGLTGENEDTPRKHAKSAKNRSKIASQKILRYPFYTQCISLYVPLFPKGFDKPLSSVARQHLEPLLNRYSSALRGMLLSYKNVNISDQPQRANTKIPPTDTTPATLHSRDEYAVGFGYLTADMTLFVPSRGSYLEGEVKLQNEGNIGVVCFNRFNASIEAKRLNKAWKWVDLTGTGSLLSGQMDENGRGEEKKCEDTLGETGQEQELHSTGYWVDENSHRVSGKLLFRISSWDTGTASDYQYLSMKGTMLDEEEEQALVVEERQMERKRRAKQNPLGPSQSLTRHIPEFSITKFGEDEEDSRNRVAATATMLI